MQLSDEQFQPVIEAVSVLESQPVLDDDRRAPRVRTSGGLQLYPWGAPQQRGHVPVRDLSRGGMGVLRSCRAGLDDLFVVELPQSQAKPALSVVCTVAYWEPLAENLYAIGLQFQRVLDAAEVNAQDDDGAPAKSTGVLARIGQMIRWRAA